MTTETTIETLPLSYKGRPLRRKENLIYYGSMADAYIVLIQILDTRKSGDMQIANRVSVQLQRTDNTLKTRDLIIKRSEKENLFTAIDIASIWLERALSSR